MIKEAAHQLAPQLSRAIARIILSRILFSLASESTSCADILGDSCAWEWRLWRGGEWWGVEREGRKEEEVEEEEEEEEGGEAVGPDWGERVW